MLGRFLNYALVPIQTRVFHPDAYGVVTQFYTYTAFINILFTYGMETAFFRYATTREDKKQVYDTSMVSLIFSSIVLSGLLMLFANPIADWFQFQGHTEYVYILAWIMALDALVTIPFAYLRQENRPIRFATYKLVGIFVNVGLNIFFLIICPWVLANKSLTSLHGVVSMIYNPDLGVEYVFVANLVASLITLIVMFKYFIIKSWSVSVKLWMEMLRYAWPLIIVGLAGMGNEMLSRYLLTRRWNGTHEQALFALGIFGACYKLSILMALFIQAYRMAAEPFFFNESKKSDPQITYARTMNYFVIFCCFIFLLVMCFIDFFKSIFMGKEYYEGIVVVPQLLYAYIWLGIYYNLTIWYKLTNQNLMGGLIAFGGVIITFALNWWWIPVYGYIGSSWATFITYAAMMLVSFVLGQKYYPVPYDVKRFFLYISAAFLLYIVDRALDASLPSDLNILSYLFGITAMATFFGIVYYVEKGKVAFLQPI